MPIEQFKNGAASTLSGNSGGIDAAVTSFNVANGSLFPSTGVFRLLIGTELLKVGGRSGNLLTGVARGTEGTTAAAHTDGDAVTMIVTAEALKNLVTPTRVVLTPPPSTGWTWDNQGTSVVADEGDSQVLTIGAVGNTGSMVAWHRAAPAAPFTLTVFMRAIFMQKQWQGVGLTFRQSSDGKLHIFHCSADDLGLTTLALRSTKFTTSVLYSADYQNVKIAECPQWWRIRDDGTNRILYVSPDGLNWLQIHSIGRTDFLTANQIGIAAGNQNVATPNFGPIIRLLSWEVT